MKRFKEYIVERKQVGELYHITSMQNLPSILRTNKLKSHYDYVSFTRDKNLINDMNNDFGTILITLDGEKLSDKYKIQPFDYFSRRKTRGGYGEREERIMKKEIPNIAKYIKSIEVNKDDSVKFPMWNTGFEDIADWDHFKNIINNYAEDLKIKKVKFNN